MAEVDPSIALQTLKPFDPVGTLGQIYALRAQRQEGQLRGIQVQQAGQSLKDDQAERAAFSQNTTVDPQTGQPVLNRQGALGQLYQTAPLRAVQRTQEFAVQDLARAKAAQENQKLQLENTGAQIGLAGQLAGSVKDQTTYDNFIQTGIRGGWVRPGQYPAVYSPETMASVQNSAMTAQQQLEAHQKDLAQKDIELHNHEIMLHDQAMESNAQATLAQTTKRDSQTAVYQRGELGLRAGQLAVDRGRLGVEQQNAGVNAKRLDMEYSLGGTAGGSSSNLHGEQYIQTLAPGLQPLVRGMLAGKIDASNRPNGQILKAAALQADPTYSDSRYSTVQSFTGSDGKGATEVKGIATMLEHYERSKKNSAAVGLSPTLGSQKIAQDGKQSAYLQDQNFYAEELGKLVKGGAMTQGEADLKMKNLTSAFQKTRDSALDEMANLFGGRARAIAQGYKNGTGQEFDPTQFFDQPTVKRLAGVVNGGRPFVGQVEDGHKYVGGDPSKPASWQAVK